MNAVIIRAALRTETARTGGPVAVARQQALVVLARSPDGRWRVVAQTAGDPDLPPGRTDARSRCHDR